MKFVILASLLFSFTSFAKDMNLSCKASFNMETVFESEVTLGNEKVNVGEFENFIYFVTQKADGRVELQSHDMDEPSRSYATASLKNVGDYVELSIWNRAYIMDVRCTLLN